jgi:hypothetical protein
MVKIAEKPKPGGGDRTERNGKDTLKNSDSVPQKYFAIFKSFHLFKTKFLERFTTADKLDPIGILLKYRVNLVYWARIPHNAFFYFL